MPGVKLVQWIGSISLSAAVVCGIAEYVAWDRLKIVPCANGSVVEWKGMTRCVPHTDAVLWHALDYGLYIAFILLLMSTIIFSFLKPKK